MTSLLELPPQLQQVLGAHAAFGRLGFKADDIYTGCAPLVNCSCPLRHVMVQLRIAGQGEFSIDCGPTTIATNEEWAAFITPALEAWNRAPQSERELIYQRSAVCRDAVTFSMALAAKGIALP